MILNRQQFACLGRYFVNYCLAWSCRGSYAGKKSGRPCLGIFARCITVSGSPHLARRVNPT